MIALLTAHRLWILGGTGLVALGVYVLVHPELFRGASLTLLGVAALERGSAWMRRILSAISERVPFGGPPDGGESGGRRAATVLVTRRGPGSSPLASGFYSPAS